MNPQRLNSRTWQCFSLVLVLLVIASLSFISFPIASKARGGGSATPKLENLNRTNASADSIDEYVPGEVLVGFRPGAQGKQNEARDALGAKLLKDFSGIGLQHWRLPAGLEVEKAVEILSKNPNVKYAEPNYVVHTDQLPSSPNDERRSDLWGLHNLGQSGGTLNADINAPEAWSVSTGSQNVVVGVIDTGIDYNHPDLQNNVWMNPGETGTDGGGHNKATNGIDDDGNGYIDDVRGWDFANNDNDPFDDNGHGTHTSGTIGAEGNNSIGIVGVNWHVRIMPLKFLGANGSGDTANAVAAMLYAAKFKDAGGANIVRITSNSWSGGKRSSALQDAIANSGALVVAAAGNGGSNQAVFPAGYNNSNILSVAATDHNDGLATFSNYSSSWVDLGAPGVKVISTWPNNQFRSLDGTSMACPHVAGVAALILATSPTSSVATVKARIMNSVDPISSLAGKTVTGGRLNAGRALLNSDLVSDNCGAAPCVPTDVTDLAVDAGDATATSVTMRLTATGDDGVIGSAYLYDVRYSNAFIDSSNFSQATVANGEPVPQSSGVADSITITGLKPNTTYYFALRVADEVGHYSALATTSGTTAPGEWSISVLDDPANNVGFYSSVAYDLNAYPYIAYSDETADDVKLAAWNGSQWDIQTVDAGTGVRTGISLAFDRNNNPTVSYGWGVLKFAQWVPSTQSWQLTTLESRYANNDVTSLAYAPDGSPSISYRTITPKGGYLKFAKKTATGWTLQNVAFAGARYNSLAYDAVGNPSIAFSDDIDGDNSLDTLKFAHWNGSTWEVQTVESGVVGYGVFASLAYDNTGKPAIVHGNSGEIRFLRWNGSSWNPAEIVDNGRNLWLTFNSADGKFYVSSNNEIGQRLSKQEASGWTTELIEPVSAPARVRWIAPLAMSPCGTLSMPYSTSPNNDLKFATKCPLGP